MGAAAHDDEQNDRGSFSKMAKSASNPAESAPSRKEPPKVTEQKFIKMIRLLFDNREKLQGAGIDIDGQDRLGRTVLHLAAQAGMNNLVKELIKSK